MLQELKDKAQVAVKEDVEQMKTSITKTIEDLRQVGMRYAASNLDKEYKSRIRRARISEFGFKVIKAADIEKFTKRIARPTLKEIMAIAGIVVGAIAVTAALGYGCFQLCSTGVIWKNVLGVLCGIGGAASLFILFAVASIISEQGFSAADLGLGHRLAITPVDQYPQAIPSSALQELLTAGRRNLFDSFSVLHVEKNQDPILVGKLNDSNDLYMLAEWGDDVTFDDIVKCANTSSK